MHDHTGTRHDFDFLVGTWHVNHRKLRHRLAGCVDWDEFEGPAQCRPYLDGLANVDQLDIPALGFSGMSVRAFDQAAAQWAIHWISSTTGRIDPPVRGRFSGDVGTFTGTDEHAGRPVEVRFVWTRLGADGARWEQAFREADGNWEVNWTMAFARVAD